MRSKPVLVDRPSVVLIRSPGRAPWPVAVHVPRAEAPTSAKAEEQCRGALSWIGALARVFLWALRPDPYGPAQDALLPFLSHARWHLCELSSSGAACVFVSAPRRCHSVELLLRKRSRNVDR